MPAQKISSIKDLSPEQIVTIICLMEIEQEPLHGFTLKQIYAEISDTHPGSEGDLLEKLNILKSENPACLKKGKYWGTPEKQVA